jgi:hypothetical protein
MPLFPSPSCSFRVLLLLVVLQWRPSSLIAVRVAGAFWRHQGYGVELALKNMEYKAVDDSQQQQQQQQPQHGGASGQDAGAAAVTVPEEEIVDGFQFSALLSRRPALRSELLAFRESLTSGKEKQLEQLKVWELKGAPLSRSFVEPPVVCCLF